MFFDMLRRRMKAIIIVVVAAFALTLLYVGGGSFFSGRTSVEAVAKVNGRTITALQLQEAYFNTVMFYLQFGQNITRVQEEPLRYSVLRSLVDRELILDAARKERVRVDRSDVDARLNEIKEFWGDQYQEQLRQAGLTERELRTQLEDELLIEAMQELKSRASITDEELLRAYEERLERIRVRHILVAPPALDSEADWNAALLEAEQLLARLHAGEDFAALAMEHSDDPGSAFAGGDLGLIGRDEPFVQEFLDAAFSLEVGQVSEPVRTAFGYHLIQVTEKVVEEGLPFEEVKEQLRAELEAARARESWETWLESVRQTATVEILDAQLRARHLANNGLHSQAIAQYREAIERNPNDPYLHFHLAEALMQVEAYDEALEEYRLAAELAVSDPELWFVLGLGHRERGEREAAKDAFVKASEYAPTNISLHQILADLFAELGYDDLSEAEAQKAEELTALYVEQLRMQQEQLQLQQMLQQQLQESLSSEGSAPAGEGGDGE